MLMAVSHWRNWRVSLLFLWTSPVLPVSHCLVLVQHFLPALAMWTRATNTVKLCHFCALEKEQASHKHSHKSISFIIASLCLKSISLYDYFVFTWEIHTTPQYCRMINVIIFRLLMKKSCEDVYLCHPEAAEITSILQMSLLKAEYSRDVGRTCTWM